VKEKKKKKVRHVVEKKEDNSILKIDLLNLEEEWANQPELYKEWADQLALARKEHEEAKAALEVAKAEASNDIRKHPKAFDLDKVTEKAIELLYPSHEDYMAAQQKVIDAKYAMDMLQGMVTALDHRKKALEKEVDLHGQGYYSVPQAREDYGRKIKADAAQREVTKRSRKERQ
jgi:capsule polysaccharide export protein KpsE/RkpR